MDGHTSKRKNTAAIISRWQPKRIWDVSHLLTTSQIHQVEFSTQLLLSLHVLLLDVDQEDAVAPRTVLIHVCTKTEQNIRLQRKRANTFPAVLEMCIEMCYVKTV